MSAPSGDTKITKPLALPHGGTIGISAPASAVKPERLNSAIAAMKSAGYDVITSPSAFGNDGLFSAPDGIRKSELEKLFTRSDVDAVLCARGGVGTGRLLGTLDTKAIAESQKPFLGFSDVTVLQWLLWSRHHFVTFSGPLAVEWDGAISDASLKRALDMLAGTAPQNLLNGFSVSDAYLLRGAGKVNGRLLPGNLSMITTLLGTPYLPDLRGAILFIEDVNEPPHRVDRMLFHLRNAGVLDGIAALLCGELVAANGPETRVNVERSLRDATSQWNYPIALNLPYGHGSERATLPVGARVEFDAETMSLTLLESVIEDAV